MKMVIDFKRIFLIVFLLIIVPTVFFILGWVGHVIFEERTIIKINAAPADRINLHDLSWSQDGRFCIDIKNTSLAAGVGKSMLPTFGERANVIEVEIKSENDIYVGDIVEYYSPEIDDYILHRIIEIKKDEFGTYFVMKGDNNDQIDSGKVRFSQLKKVVVAVIY